jgi:hypothetical protein
VPSLRARVGWGGRKRKAAVRKMKISDLGEPWVEGTDPCGRYTIVHKTRGVTYLVRRRNITGMVSPNLRRALL